MALPNDTTLPKLWQTRAAQAEVFNGAILQQAFVVEFVVEDHMCPDCTRRAVNPNQWVACVQVSHLAPWPCARATPHSILSSTCEELALVMSD